MKLKRLLLILVCILVCTGCFKRDNMDNIKIYTTTYPIEYLINRIYGFNSYVDSIYPNGVNVYEYNLTNKQIKEYSKYDMIVYNGLSSKEKTIAASFLNNNSDIKVLDVTSGINLQNDDEELWLSPSNYLMLAQNAKNELLSFINSTVLIKEIEDNYEDLKLEVSKYDAELKLIAENASNNKIVAGNNLFEFLTKYGYNVANLEDDNDISTAKSFLANDNVHYIFMLDTDEETDTIKALVSAGAKLVKIPSMINRTEEQVKNGTTYQTMMETFIDSIKTEVYN